MAVLKDNAVGVTRGALMAVPHMGYGVPGVSLVLKVGITAILRPRIMVSCGISIKARSLVCGCNALRVGRTGEVVRTRSGVLIKGVGMRITCSRMGEVAALTRIVNLRFAVAPSSSRD